MWPGNVEFYTQCVDGVISSTSTVKPDSIAAYSIIKPPIYPSEFKTGFRNPYAPMRSHLRTFPLGRLPTCAHSHLGAFPLGRVPTWIGSYGMQSYYG